MSVTNQDIDFSGVLPTEKDTLSIPDVDLSGVLSGKTSNQQPTDSLSFEKVLGQTQSYKKTLASFEKSKESRIERREWLRSNIEGSIIPEYILDIFNESTMGTAMEAVKGGPVFRTEMSSGIPQGWLYGTAVNVGSFFGSPVDIGLTMSGGRAWQTGVRYSGADKLAKKGFEYLVKKDKITPGMAKTAMADMAGQAMWWTGALAAHAPFYNSAVNVADAISQANQPQLGTFISDAGDKYVTQPSQLGKPKGIIDSKYGVPTIGTGKEQRGLPLDVAMYIDGQRDYYDVSINGGRKKPIIDLSALENADDSKKFETAMKLIIANPQLKDVAKGASTGLTLAAARLGFRYLPANVLSKGATPLSTPRGAWTTIGGEVGTLTAASSLIEGDFPPSISDITLGAGIVLASRIPGLLSRRASRIKTKYQERPRTGPMSDEMKRKVAAAAEAEVVDVNRLGNPPKKISQGEKPPSSPTSVDTKPVIVGSQVLPSPSEFATILRRAQLSERKSRTLKDIYTLVDDPIIHIKDASFLKLGVPLYERTKSGELVMTGYTPSETEHSIRMLNRNDLPSGMATGDYMNTKIVGIPDNSDKSGIERLLDRKELPLGPNARIVRDSIKSTDVGLKFNVEMGSRTYELDEINSDLFLKFYTAQPLLKSNFENNNKRIFKNKFALTKIRRSVLNSLIKDEMNVNLPNIISGDFRQAINSVALSTNHEKWLDVIKKSNESKVVGSTSYRIPIKVNDMSELEMKLVTERMQDVRAIRNWSNYIIDNLESSGSLRQIVEIDKNNFLLNAFAPYMSQLGNEMSSPAAKSLLGMYSKVDRNIVVAATSDIYNFQLAIGMDKEVLSVKKMVPTFVSKTLGYNPFRSEMAEKWITGKPLDLSDGTRVTGFNDYLILSNDASANRIFGQMKSKVKKVNANPEKFNYTPEEIVFLNYRVNAIAGIKRVMDNIAKDALAANIQMPGIKKFYMPFVMDRKFRDVIYTSMKDLNYKVNAIVGHQSFVTSNTAQTLSPDKMSKVRLEIKNWLKRLTDSQNKYKRGTAVAWREAEKEVRNMPGNKGKNISELDTWLTMNTTLYNEGFSTYGHLEKKRTLLNSGGSTKNEDILVAVQKAKLDLLDRNLSTLFTDYILGARKKIELTKMFGNEGKLIDKMLDLIPEEDALSGIVARALGKQSDITAEKAGVPPIIVKSQRDALRVVKDLITGESQYSRHNQLSAFNDKMANILFTNKISAGFATFNNAMQPFISYFPDLGVWSSVRGTTGYFIDPKIHEKILKKGPTSLTLLDELIPGSRALKITTEKLATPREGVISKLQEDFSIENLTQFFGKPFMLVNLANKIGAAGAADDYIKKMAKLLSGKQSPMDKLELRLSLPTVKDLDKYARNKLAYRFNLDPDEVIKYASAIISDTYVTPGELAFENKIGQSIEGYAQWSQAGRDFSIDSFSANDPNSRMFSLFKRWGKSQAFMMNDIYEFEMSQGNYLIPLTIASNGVFGGYMAARAIEFMKDTLSGEKEYLNKKYKNRLEYRGRQPKIRDVFSGKDKFFMEDLRDAMVTAGTLGMLSDIALENQKFESLKFAVSPAGWNDLDALRQLFTTLLVDAPSSPSTDANITSRYLLQNVISRVIGSQLNHLIIKRINWEPWHGYVLDNWKLQPITGQVPKKVDANRIRGIRKNKVTELADLAFNLSYGPNKDSTRRQINDILLEWNSNADTHKYWDGIGFNPYAIYMEKDIWPKVQEKWIEKMNANKSQYELDPSDRRRKQSRPKY